MKFTLTGEPISTQSLYGLTCRNNYPVRYVTKKGKDLKTDYQWQIKSQFRNKKIIKKNVGLEVKLYFGTKRKQDIDNFNKILYDAFSGIVWEDDSQILSVLTEKEYDKKNPRIELEVYEIL